MIGRILCKLKVHWMRNHHHNFIDSVSGKTVFNAECPCGKRWMVDTLSPITFFKVDRDEEVCNQGVDVEHKYNKR